MKLFQALLLSFALVFSVSAYADKVNINTANAEQIAEIMNGIGSSKAQAIVEYRKTHGKFQSIDDLENVDGIGQKTVNKNKSKVTL